MLPISLMAKPKKKPRRKPEPSPPSTRDRLAQPPSAVPLLDDSPGNAPDPNPGLDGFK